MHYTWFSRTTREHTSGTPHTEDHFTLGVSCFRPCRLPTHPLLFFSFPIASSTPLHATQAQKVPATCMATYTCIQKETLTANPPTCFSPTNREPFAAHLRFLCCRHRKGLWEQPSHPYTHIHTPAPTPYTHNATHTQSHIHAHPTPTAQSKRTMTPPPTTTTVTTAPAAALPAFVPTLPASASIVVTVTGASGYLGEHLVKALLEAGYTVRGTVRDPSNEEKHKVCTKALLSACAGPTPPTPTHPIQPTHQNNRRCSRPCRARRNA